MTATLETPQIKYGTTPLQNFRVSEIDELTGNVTMMEVDGHPAIPNDRFWTSLCSTFSTYGLSTRLFRLFRHEEVFERISNVAKEDRLQFAFEEKGDTPANLLAVTLPGKPIVPVHAIQDRILSHAISAQYRAGIVTTTHEPAHMSNFEIGGDEFAHRYVLETPVDGFGCPLIYLSMLRHICSNGMVGYGRAFRSDIKLGGKDDDPIKTIGRHLDSFNNEEGYAALRARCDAATNSWASIQEANNVYKTLVGIAKDSGYSRGPADGFPSLVEEMALRRGQQLGGDGASAGDAVSVRVQRAFSGLVGDICQIYGLSHLDAMSQKRMSQLPVRATVYDLFNFVTEVATHYTDHFGGRRLQAIIGNMLGTEYDLEGSKTIKSEFADWFTSVN